ncbi:MAG: GGDEF domain-containing protein [Acidobacteria bacterium]|nr:GGDEF domain-containing protein [Acidobacteriota bacterium]
MTVDSRLSVPELRTEIAQALKGRHEPLVRGLVSMLSTGIPLRLPPAVWSVLAAQMARSIALAIEESAIDTAAQEIIQLQQLRQQTLASSRFFSAFYLAERVILDELSLVAGLGTDSDSWPTVTQLVRRASYDVLAACCDSGLDATELLTDRLTSLPSEAVFRAVLSKEILRAARHDHPLALIVFDVDRMGEVNDAFGYGVGDLLLERIGILMRSYFRQLDWVARLGSDSFAVLLPETTPDDAAALAEGARATVDERLAFRDHRTEQQVRITVSAVVLTALTVDGAEIDEKPVDASRLLEAAASAIRRAQPLGGNRVEKIQIASVSKKIGPRERPLI